MLRGKRCLVALLIVSFAAAASCAAQDGMQRKSADIQIWGIRATTKNKQISPALKKIAKQLKKQFKYTGFLLESQHAAKVNVGSSTGAKLAGGHVANVKLKQHGGKRITVEVEVSKGKKKIINSTVTVNAGRFQLFAISLGGGEALIVAVSAR